MMKTRTLALALLVALTPATFSMPVRAQAPAEDATTGMARARFKEGVSFYDKGEFEQARASFLQAYALKKHPAVLLNLAWSCLKSGHVLEGEKYFKQLLTEGKDITDKQRADATDGLAQSHAKLGRIEVVAAAGTEVTVDGERVGAAPLSEAVSVEAGAHTVKFKGPDGTTETQSVTVLGGEMGTARSGRTAAATVAPAPPPAPPAEATSAPPPPAPEAATKPTEAAVKERPAESDHGSRLLAPPRNLVPAVILGVVAVAGYAAAGILVAFKNEAQQNANTAADQIVAHGGTSGTCTPQGLARAPQFDQACHAYATDNNNVNSDATGGNIAVAVGIAATAGFVVYWLVADKGDAGKSAGRTPVVTPLVGRSLGGLSVSASF
jgi:hypothetical protein